MLLIQVLLLQTLLSLLLPHNTKLKEEIEEVLDVELIQQQVENASLDFPVSILKPSVRVWLVYTLFQMNILSKLEYNETSVFTSLCNF